MSWPKLVLLGDSNMQFGYAADSQWVSKLSDALQRKCDVLNRGLSGYTSHFVRGLMSELFERGLGQNALSANVCGVVLMLGSNDSASADNHTQHVPLDTYRANMTAIVEHLLAWGLTADRIIAITPPRKVDSMWNDYCQRQGYECTHFDRLTGQYAAACASVASERGLTCVDLHRLTGEPDDGPAYAELLNDGLHLSVKGGQLLFEHLRPIVDAQIGDKLPFQLPYWRDLVNTKTAATSSTTNS